MVICRVRYVVVAIMCLYISSTFFLLLFSNPFEIKNMYHRLAVITRVTEKMQFTIKSYILKERMEILFKS